MVKAVRLLRPCKELPEDVCPGAGRLVLIARGHEGGTHRASHECALAAVG